TQTRREEPYQITDNPTGKSSRSGFMREGGREARCECLLYEEIAREWAACAARRTDGRRTRRRAARGKDWQPAIRTSGSFAHWSAQPSQPGGSGGAQDLPRERKRR